MLLSACCENLRKDIKHFLLRKPCAFFCFSGDVTWRDEYNMQSSPDTRRIPLEAHFSNSSRSCCSFSSLACKGVLTAIKSCLCHYGPLWSSLYMPSAAAFEMRLLTCQLRIQCSPQPQLHSHTVASWSVEWNETVCYDCYDWQTIKVFAWWYVLQTESTLYRNFEVFTYVKAMLARLGRHYIFCETKRCLFPCLYSP